MMMSLFTLENKVGAVDNNYMTLSASYRNEICQTYIANITTFNWMH